MLTRFLVNRITAYQARARARRLEANERASLRTHFPRLPATRSDSTLRSIEDEYAPFHAAYCSDVSSSRAAVSLPQAALLAYLIRQNDYAAVLDAGSGFSTFVLRRESLRRGGVRHIAVEDNGFWLDKTRAYLAKQNLSSDDVVAWEDFEKHAADIRFDLIFHDMGDPTTRILSLPALSRRLSDKGWLILDDMHKSHYYPHALRLLRDDWITESMVGLTLDSLGRFAYISKRADAKRDVQQAAETAAEHGSR